MSRNPCNCNTLSLAAWDIKQPHIFNQGLPQYAESSIFGQTALPSHALLEANESTYFAISVIFGDCLRDLYQDDCDGLDSHTLDTRYQSSYCPNSGLSSVPFQAMHVHFHDVPNQDEKQYFA